MAKRLCKSRKNKIIDGVCGGIAEYFNIDPTIVRILAVVIACIKGAGVVAYILACIIMPYADNQDSSEDDVDNLKSANVDEEEKSESGKSNKKDSDKNKSIHSDEEFNDFFKK